MKINRFIFLACILATLSSQTLADTVLNVMLQEWRIVTDKQTIPSGPVKIVVQNRGQETHEFVLLKTNLPYSNLPLDLKKGGISEESAGSVVDEIEDLTSKSKKQMTVNLKPGNYVLLCNMVEIEDGEKEQHYTMGMRAPIIVK